MTFTIDNNKINQNYSQYEIQLKIVNFLQKEMKEESVELFEVFVEDMPKIAQERFNNIEKLNFVNY